MRWLGGLAFVVGCSLLACAAKSDQSSVPPAQPEAKPEPEPAAKTDVVAAVASLKSPDPKVREAAAADLRRALADPAVAATVDRGKAYWAARVAEAVEKGMSMADVERALGATMGGGGSSGGSSSMQFVLDDYWTVTAHFNSRSEPEELFEVDEVSRAVAHAWVAPPEKHTGRWVTYFVNGVIAQESELTQGVPTRRRSYHDTGELTSEQAYVNGKRHGVQRGFHRNGKPSYIGHFENGIEVGEQTHWFDDGELESDCTYVNGQIHGLRIHRRRDGSKVEFHYDHGKEIGQAAWDENGKLLYAHGAAARDSQQQPAPAPERRPAP